MEHLSGEGEMATWVGNGESAHLEQQDVGDLFLNGGERSE